MAISIFDYTDYKDYLRDWITERPGEGRGEKSRIAHVIRCHTAYVTQVFNGDAHLSLEQASDLSAHLGHRSEEEKLFLLQVQLARSGSARLKRFFSEEIQKIVDSRIDLQNRLQFKAKLSEQNQAIYYSSWYYSAIYALTSVPGFQNPQNVAAHLLLPLRKVSEVLDFLASTGLLILEKGEYRIGKTSIHLGNDSAMISKHHSNWRIKAIQSLDQPRDHDLHYSSVISLAKKDAPKLRAILVKTIEEIRPLVAQSNEEEIFAYSLDFFKIP